MPHERSDTRTTTDEVVDALRTVADPCCRERGISVVDMGLLHDVRLDDDAARIDILLTSGWCPFQVDLLDEITRAVVRLPGLEHAEVNIRLDEVWSTERMTPDARAKLRFLPEPGDAGDPDQYLAAHRKADR